MVCAIGCATVFVPAILTPAHAAVPQTISYQSRLLNSSGTPITVATDIQFSLYLHGTNGTYTDLSSQVGPLVWKETRDQAAGACAKIVPDAKGYFFLNLGSCVAFPSYLKFDQPLYLGVRIGADAEALPRILLSVSPYTLNTQRVGSFSDTGAGGLRGESQGTSTALTPGVNSAKLLLQGSGWDGLADNYREMKLLNTVTDANTYRLSILNDTDTEIFSVDNSGTVTSTSMYLTNNLYLRGIRVDSVGSTNLSSGAYLVGVFDEFANSNATTVQATLRDFDLAISTVSTTLRMTDLQRVTNSGNTTTNALQFAGGTSTDSFLVQGQLNATGDLIVGQNAVVTGMVSSTGALFVNATGTNLVLLGQLQLGNFNTLPASGTTGSLVYAMSSSTAYLWDGFAWQPIATGTLSGSDLQYVTERGNATTLTLQFAGGTSTGNFVPSVDNAFSLGLASLRWRDIYLFNLFASGTSIMQNLTVLGSVTTTNLFTTNLFASGTTSLNDLTVNNVTTTNFFASGTTSLNNLLVNNVTTTNMFASGTTSLNNLIVNNVTTTNLFASGTTTLTNLTVTGTTTLNNLSVNNVSTTSITVNGQTVTSVASTLQDATDNGNVTTNSIQFAGGTSTANFNIDGYLALGGIRLDALGTNSTTSGAFLVGVYDNFSSINATTVQGAFEAIDSLLSSMSTSTGSYFVGLTALAYNGNFSAFGKVGYQAANAICESEYPGSHFCRTDEMLQTISDKDIAALFVATTFGWISEGPPGYTANSNDCTGYTTSNNLYLGAFWGFDPNGGGAGWLTNCSNTRKISCCKK